MVNKTKYEAFVSPIGTAVYPYLISPDVQHNPEGVYKTDLAVPAELAAPFIERLEGVLEGFFTGELNSTQQSTLAKKPVWRLEYTRPEFPQDATDAEKDAIRAAFTPEETGNVLFRIKMNAQFTTKKGEVIKQTPVVVAAETGERITENVWSGSTIRVKGQVVPYVNAAAQIAGVSLRLKSVQVIELVTGGEASGFWTDFGDDEAA